MQSDTRIVAEIGLLIYPDAQLAAVYGLTDLFRIAGETSGAQLASLAIRVTHWRRDAVSRSVDCVYDSHPGAPHQLTHLIAPPSIVMPDKMQSMHDFSDWLIGHHAAGATLCSVCAGAFVLGEAGLLEGREATTHIITAGGILAWTDLGLTLVERLLGASVMLDTARFLLVDPPGRAQRPYRHFVPRLDHGDQAILRVQHWLHATNARESSVATLAQRAELEERTFLPSSCASPRHARRSNSPTNRWSRSPGRWATATLPPSGNCFVA
jgi:transcriptional regulator GlxA family with amidase domain